MAITNPSLTAMVTATTAASGANNKMTALMTGLVTAIINEYCLAGAVTPQQQVHSAALLAEAVANVGDIVTANT